MTFGWAFVVLILRSAAGEYEMQQGPAFAERVACEVTAQQAPWDWIVLRQQDGLCALMPLPTMPTAKSARTAR